MIDFWFDIWHGDQSLASLLSVWDPPYLLAGEFFSLDGWNVSRLQQWVPKSLVRKILTIPSDPSVAGGVYWRVFGFLSLGAYPLKKEYFAH